LIFGTVVAMIPPISAATVPSLQQVRPSTVALPVSSEPVEAGD